jgi:hypothetical protein
MTDQPDGPTIDEIVIGDEPQAWRAIGFEVDADDVIRLGQVRLRLVGRGAGSRIRGWSMRDLTGSLGTDDLDGLDGLPTTTSTRPAAEPAAHPLGAVSIDHVVVYSPDRLRTTAALESVGFPARRVRHTDSYGAPMSQTFFRAGEVIIELVSLEADPAAADPEAPDPPVPAARAEVPEPASFFGLALTVTDLDAAAARLGEGMGSIKPAVQAGRRIATLRHRDLGLSVATALMSPEGGRPAEPGGRPTS